MHLLATARQYTNNTTENTKADDDVTLLDGVRERQHTAYGDAFPAPTCLLKLICIFMGPSLFPPGSGNQKSLTLGLQNGLVPLCCAELLRWAAAACHPHWSSHMVCFDVPGAPHMEKAVL